MSTAMPGNERSMQLTEIVAQSRAEQGLPERVADPAVLDRVASLLTATTAGNGARDV